jgi:RNA polymerase sigma factor (sigma-70 family)
MEVSALKYSGGLGLHGRSPLLRLQSDERLVGLTRRGNTDAFEVLVSRYGSRLLAFCRHLLGSREDAEDVLQEVLAASFNAMLADDRPINVRPWLYRIARNRCLNHLRRMQAVGVDSMDIHLSDNGASTADKVHEREEFRLLVGDIHSLPETQKTALVLREMDALSYEQIAEAMETTVPSVKSLLVRARVSLAEASEARLLSCEEVRIELGEVAEGLQRRPSPLVRRHLRACQRCDLFRGQLKETNKALAALLPIGPLVLLKKLALTHIGHSAGSSAAAGSSAGSGAAAGSSAAVASSAAAGSSIVAGSGAGGFVTAGIGAMATKAAAGLAAAALVTAGAVEVDHSASSSTSHAHAAVIHTPVIQAAIPVPQTPATHRATSWSSRRVEVHLSRPVVKPKAKAKKDAPLKKGTLLADAPPKPDAAATTTVAAATTTTTPTPDPIPGRTQTQTDATVLEPPAGGTTTTAAPATVMPIATTPATPTTTTPATPVEPATPTTTTDPAPSPTTTTDPTPPPTDTAPPPDPAPTTTTDPAPTTTTDPTPPPTD